MLSRIPPSIQFLGLFSTVFDAVKMSSMNADECCKSAIINSIFLERGSCVAQSKRHYIETVRPFTAHERSNLLGSFGHFYLPVSGRESTVLKKLQPCSLLDSTFGIGKQFFSVTSFTFRKSTQNRSLPSGFFTNTIDEAHALFVGSITFIHSIFSTHSSTTFSLPKGTLYGRYFWFFTILCHDAQIGHRPTKYLRSPLKNHPVLVHQVLDFHYLIGS